MIRTYRILLLLVAALSYSCVSLYAQRQEPMLDSVLKGRDEKLFVGAEAYVEDEKFYDPAWSGLIGAVNKVTNVVSLRIDEYHNVPLPDSFSLTALVRVIYSDKNNAEDSVERSLTITYNKKRSYNSRAFFYFSNAHKVNVKVLQLTAQHALLPAFIEAVDLSNEMLFDRNFVLNCSNHSIEEVTVDDTDIELTGELQVSWPPVNVAEEYDLEWTYIDRSALESGRYNTSGQLNPDLLFKYNASRVTIGAEIYKIPLLYDGDGILYIRVRAAQTLEDGQRVTTPWSSDFSSAGGLGEYDFEGHERKLNWQSSTSFAEEGKRKTVVQYFDGSLKGRQTVTKDNTTDTTVIAETLYDRQGRPVIQVLPAPSLSSIIAFTPRFNIGLNSIDYDKGVYDTLFGASDYCEAGTPAMDTASGASYYYSSYNHNAGNGIHQYIPNGYGFVFTETRYTQDNTGRINAQSGVGPDFRLGTGKETKYYYGSADQEELDALFGTEAGDAAHYQKNMVRDANGQYSVSYVDMHGRTVATALAGESPVTLSALTSYTSSTHTTSLLTATNNIQKGTTLESVKGLLVPKEGTHYFEYQLNPESLELDNCENDAICYDCLYDLEITVTDDCNNQTLPGDTAYKAVLRNFSLGNIDATCTAAQPLSVSFSLFLEAGSYTITKKLTINEEAMQYYRDSVYLAQNTCKSYEDIVNEQTSIILAQLGDCTPYFNEMHDYEMHRQQMLRHMMPVSGQYADTAEGKAISIFSYPPAENHAYRNQSGYKDGDGQPALVDINGVATPPQWLSRQDFIDNFEESWAEALLPLHPEYNLLLEYEKLASSHIWSEDYEQTDTYSAAMTKGYLNPAGNTLQAPASGFDVVEPDPLFTVLNNVYGSTVANNARTSINNSLQNYIQQEEISLTAWGMATVFAKCPDNGEVIDETCRITWAANANVFSDELCEGELDMAWRFFRGAYLQIRYQWIDNFIRQRVGDPSLLPDYAPVFLKKDSLMAQAGFADIASISPQTARDRGKDSLDVLIQTSCLEYAQRWVQQLGPCNYEQYNEEALDIIISRLVEVCREGGDEKHPLGASTVRPSSTYEYRSFEDVIRQYNEDNELPYDASCNAYLIDLPKPYNQPVALIDKPMYSKPDSCDCDRISTVYAQYSANSANYASFSDYMQKRQGTTISDAALTTLLELCNNTITCKFIPQPVNLPPALQCGTGDACVDCNEVRNRYDSFAVKFPGTVPTREEESEEQRDKNRLFGKYMNWHLGFDKTVPEYLDFIENCIEPVSDSLGKIAKDFKDIYKDAIAGRVYKNYKITPAAHALVDAANALLQARHTAEDPVLPQGYAMIPRTSDYSAKLLGIAPNSTSYFHAIVPLPLEYTTSYPELESNIVVPGDFVTGVASPEQLSRKYYAVVLSDLSTGFRGIWNREGTGSYSYYGVSRPTRKYIPDSTSIASNDSYIMRFFELPESFRSPSLYKSFLADSSLNYVINNSQIKAIKNLRLAAEVLPYPGVTENQFLRSSYGLKVTLEMTDGSEKEGWMSTGYNGSEYVHYKELTDSSVYDTDCHKSFTYYFNQRVNGNYTEAQVDSIYLEQTGELPKGCVTDCSTIESELAEYYNHYIQPSSGYVDLHMRTFAGNITPGQGPKGVFDVKGHLVGNTIDSTFDAVNQSYAQVWNSSPSNAAVGNLQYQQSGIFRLYLNPGQKAPSQGIIGQRYYQFDYKNSAIENYYYGSFGTYIDFGDSTRAYANDTPDTDSTKIIPDFWSCCNAAAAATFDKAFRFYIIRHIYNSPNPRTVTIYHTDQNGAVGFDRNSGLVGDAFYNIRGYFPQVMPVLTIHATTDSTLHDFSRVKNFGQISSIESLNLQSHGRSDCVSNIWFPSMANNRNMKLLWLEMNRLTPGAGKKPVHDWLPDMHLNFPKLNGIQVLPYDSATSKNLNFSIPALRWVSIHSGFGGNKITVDQVDQIINQVADGSLLDNGSLTIQTGSTGVVRSAASDAAVADLTARGWKLTGAGMSNTGSYVANTAPTQPNVNDSVAVTNTFTEFYNDRNGTHYTFPQLLHLYDSLCGKSLNLDSIPAPPLPAGELLCGKAEPYSQALTLFQPDACSDSTQLIAITATEIYKAYKDSLLHHFSEAYTKKCLEAGALESFTVTRPVSEYHYTLYYYDQAGNLVKTVPPAGVHPNRDSEWLEEVKTKRLSGEVQTPEHTLPTTYRYNSLNQVVSQQSPDGGLSKFWYDRLGRLVVSQNAKQGAGDWYSYTRYDHLGRITEVGEKTQATAMTDIVSRSETNLADWLNTNYTEGENTYRARQVTQTVYDVLSPVITPGLELYPRFHQRGYTLRNRVSFTRHYEKLPVSGGSPQYSQYNSATHYSYDIHGNVDTLLQDYNAGLMLAHGSYSESANNRFKLMAYHYDLISGKVNQVHYQPNEQDALYHRYEYDAENRLTDVYTTIVKEFVGYPSLEEREAAYQYYKHGPLARTILGQQQVQGIDYAYTLQGWLKGVNSTSLNPVHDMGNDSHQEHGNGLVAKDAYGFQLNYYTGLHGDYTAINRSKNPFPRHAAFMPGNEERQLYNGNISSMTVNIPRLGGPQLYNYKYDQLNRIVAMDLYRGLDVVNNTWNNDNQELVALQDYKERISYDANGNILKYLRNGTTKGGQPLAMDSLHYEYDIVNNNRLRRVTDTVAATNYKEDIDNQEDEENYVYDAIGNLIEDKAEKITNIEWSVYGKILSITKTPTTENPVSKITYTYDAAGNRISKTVEKQGSADKETTWYVRDATGNVMALYTHKDATLGAEGLKLTEQHLYGSSRLGIWNRDVDMDNAPTNSSNESLVGTAWLANFSRGKKFFELTNHLGNVLVTISDHKTMLEWDEGMANGDCIPGSAIDVLDVDTRGEETSYVGRTEVNLLPGFESGSEDEFDVYTDDALDVCVPQGGGGGSAEPFYAADVVSANDYYPFGMGMPGRKYSATTGSYRYGFNGQEKSTEIEPNGSSYTAEFWQYDARIVRRWNVDPKPTIGVSSYAAFLNNPLVFADPLGDTTIKGQYYENNKNGGLLDAVVVTGKLPKEGSRKKIVRGHFSGGTGGGTYNFYTTQGYYHRNTNTTTGGWHTAEEYLVKLSTTDAAKELASMANLTRFAGLFSEGSLDAFMKGDPTFDGFQFLNAAARLYAKHANESASGRIDFSPVNIEDLILLPFLFSKSTLVLKLEANAAKVTTPISKNSVIEGFKVSNHAWRKSGLGRGATEELISEVIIGARKAGTVITETGTGKFSGNVIKVYNHNSVKVVVDESRNLIMSIRPEKGFKLP